MHKTSDGRVMEIAEMDDKHLINFIKLVLRNAKEAKRIIDGEQKTSPSLKVLEQDCDVSESAEHYLSVFLERLYPYIVEGVLRKLDLSEIANDLQIIYERIAAKEKTFLLPLRNDSYSCPDDVDDDQF